MSRRAKNTRWKRHPLLVPEVKPQERCLFRNATRGKANTSRVRRMSLANRLLPFGNAATHATRIEIQHYSTSNTSFLSNSLMQLLRYCTHAKKKITNVERRIIIMMGRENVRPLSDLYEEKLHDQHDLRIFIIKVAYSAHACHVVYWKKVGIFFFSPSSRTNSQPSPNIPTSSPSNKL